jgi:hypothetical protein
MNERDLRIGNLVSYGVNIVPIRSIHTESVLKNEVTVYVELNEKLQNYCLNINEIEPIPLTEEWLIKMGFEIKQGLISYDKGKLCLYFGETILSGEKGRTYFNSWAILEHTPKYVHTLQNLYYALCGEELTIKN